MYIRASQYLVVAISPVYYCFCIFRKDDIVPAKSIDFNHVGIIGRYRKDDNAVASTRAFHLACSGRCDDQFTPRLARSNLGLEIDKNRWKLIVGIDDLGPVQKQYSSSRKFYICVNTKATDCQASSFIFQYCDAFISIYRYMHVCFT